MRTIAILPIKSFGAAKQRLGGMLGSGSRQALAQSMFQDVLASLRRVPELDAIAVVTSNRVAEQAARGQGVQLLADEPESGHCAAALIGIEHALQNGFERVLLVPGDTPLLDPQEVGSMLGRAERDDVDVLVVPDRHGTGTNALLLSPPAAIEPAFGPGSCERHQELARRAGVSCRVDPVSSLVLDIDTPEDLVELAEALSDRHGQASMTRGALRQIDRLGAPPPPGGKRPVPGVQVQA
jgi:2-phospho-L-lactate guanylyltransferase